MLSVMRRVVIVSLCALLAVWLSSGESQGEPTSGTCLLVLIDLSEQRMQVSSRGRLLHDWPVSTARAGKSTPTGTFVPQFLSPYHRSTLYGGAPMPWSVFFNGNFAIHGTDQIDCLGEPASAGCVRLHPDNAKLLYDLVESVGLAQTRIVIRR